MPESRILASIDAWHLAARKLPDTPDGRYSYQVQPKVTGATDSVSQALHSKITLFLDNVKSVVKQGPPKDPDQIFKSFLQAVSNPDAIDDRQGFFVAALALLCEIPPTSPLALEANNKVIEVLYRSLPHPPAMYLAPFPSPPPEQASNGGKFRAADGGGNNAWMPQLGRAGMPYARDVENKHPLPVNTLPDAGLVFDTLLRAKKDDWKPHPGGNSSLTFAFASLVTHSLFRTNPRNWNINDTNSYLDLSVLYGVSQQQQDMVRNKAEGRGYLWKDAFAEDRLILVPPAASALLVIFSRNHNYIADMILKINEQGKWSDPPPANEDQRAKQDEEIFQTARLINGGHFMAMIFGDYVAGFLGLQRDGKGWGMNPFDPIKTEDGEFLGRAEGNHVSVEFNLMYRWHAVTAQKDIKWTEDLFSEVFGTSKPFEELTLTDFGAAVGRAWGTLVDPNPRTRTFSGLKRGADGAFNDDDIARVLQDATESPAAAYRAQGTPSVLRVVEILGILQARSWGVCTMNEFRAYLGLKKFEKFEDWSSNPEVAAAARQLYGHIDNLELYPGLQAEDTMPLGPGSGICCGYTTTRAILGDAVALVRGDRFYTTDYTPANLTSWGFQDCARDPHNGSYGAALPKLLLRHLPRHYPADSVFGLFPFFTPTVNKKNLEKLKVANLYTFTRPKPAPEPKAVNSRVGVNHVLANEGTFKKIVHDERLVLGGSSKDNEIVRNALLSDEQEKASVIADFRKWTEEYIAEKSYAFANIPGKRVDVVQNVIKLVGVRWVADYLTGMPLKTVANARGLFTPQETYDMLQKLFTAVYLTDDPEGVWERTQEAKEIVQIWQYIIEQNVKELPRFGSMKRFSRMMSDTIWPAGKKRFTQVLHALSRSGSTKDTVPTLLRLAIDVAMPLTKVLSQIVDFYLDDARAKERAEIVKLANSTEKPEEAKKLLLGYALEAQRLNPATPYMLRQATAADTIPIGKDQPDVSVAMGDIVFVSLANANKDPIFFPDPETIDPRRAPAAYLLPSVGFTEPVGRWLFDEVVPEVLGAVFRLKNVRRAEGITGKLAGNVVQKLGTPTPFYLNETGDVTPWPVSMTVVYDV
ncbi:heme peroxidase [Trametopsis cervina]|nr:heme peroxidase [Trametopsis cervina]